MGNTVWENSKFFKLPFLPTQAPKLLFHCIEQCQEIALIMQNPYTQEQIIAMLSIFSSNQFFFP